MGASPKPSAPPTPLPKLKLFAVFVLNLVLGFQINVIWPFLPFMVDWLRGTEVDSALYVGILASSYFWAQFVGSFIWAELATRLGSRCCLMLGLVGVGVTFLWFGFCTTFTEAMVARSLSGLLNGNVPILKAYMATITDSSNQAKGMSILALSWGLGSAVGPLLGGYLAEPAIVYPDIFASDGPFGVYPFLLPCLTICGMSGLALLTALVLLPPDRPPRRGGQYKPVERTDEGDNGCVAADEDEDESETLLDGKGQPAGPDGGDVEVAAIYDTEPLQLLIWSKILCSRDTCSACLAYVFTALIFIIYDEMFPVFSKTAVDLGGLSFSAENIGTALSVGGVVLIGYQTIFFPRVVKALGLITSYRVGTWLTLLLTVIFPFVHLLALGWCPRPLLWAALMALSCLRMVSSANCFVGSMIIVNNSVDKANLNRVNGVCQALASLSRAVMPMMAGALWSSMLHEAWPMQPHALYAALSCLGVMMVWNGYRIDPRCGAAYEDRSAKP